MKIKIYKTTYTVKASEIINTDDYPEIAKTGIKAEYWLVGPRGGEAILREWTNGSLELLKGIGTMNPRWEKVNQYEVIS